MVAPVATPTCDTITWPATGRVGTMDATMRTLAALRDQNIRTSHTSLIIDPCASLDPNISDVWEVRMFWSRSAASVLIVASIVPTRPVAGQVIVSQVGVATGATMPTGAYHTGSLGGFNVGWQGMALVGFKLSGSPAGPRLEGTYVTNPA